MSAGMELLDEASRDGDINKLKQLLEEDPSLLDRFDHDVPVKEAGDNPLHIAASHGRVDFTVEVMRLKPQLAESANKEGRLPLHLAAARGHLEVVKKLADRADEVLAQDGQKVLLRRDSKYGYMPAHIAAINGKYDIMEILVEKCEDVLDRTTDREETLLHLAVIANCFDSVQYFIDHGVNLNRKDADGNTCLHLACKKRNHQVITYLLEQEGIDFNSINGRGLTPLDVLLVSSCDYAIDVSLVNTLRKAGGEEGAERGKQGNYKSNLRNSKRTFSSRDKHKAKTNNDAKTLLVVATLVATMTFTSISNPPGGFIQLPFDKGDEASPTWFNNWLNISKYPAGRPVLLWKLQAFFLLDSVALFSSIFVILSLLCGIPKTKIVMKFLTGVVWLAAFCTALAFAYVYLRVCVPSSTLTVKFENDESFEEVLQDYRWVYGLLITWSIVYVVAGLWGSIRVIMFVWTKGGFKRNLPSWVDRVGWPKKGWFRKTTSIIFMICFLGLLRFSAYWLWQNFSVYLKRQFYY